MKLVQGQGSERDGACWMSALHFFTRQDKSWTDEAPWACVSPLIRNLCIRLNDMCSDGEREALIGPHLFAPLGTAASREVEQQRAFMCADAGVRRFAPIALRSRGRADLADRLERLAPIVDQASCIVARDEAREVQRIAYDAYDAVAAAAAVAVAAAAYDAAYDAYDAVADAAAVAAAAYDAAYDAYDAVADAADVAVAAAARLAVKKELLALILRLCEVGERKEVSEACSRENVLEMLCR